MRCHYEQLFCFTLINDIPNFIGYLAWGGPRGVGVRRRHRWEAQHGT